MKIIAKSKTEKPLTIADLKPGAIFKLADLGDLSDIWMAGRSDTDNKYRTVVRLIDCYCDYFVHATRVIRVNGAFVENYNEDSPQCCGGCK
jgi:hypothetical protein